MQIKNIIDEDFGNYKKCSMFIGFPHCSFKCEKECGISGMCQNSELAKSPSTYINKLEIVARYINNPISSAIVIGGLEPFDDWFQLYHLVQEFRKHTEDDIVIYTGYYANEISHQLNELKKYPNIIIKFGRYIPNQEPHFDEVLGIKLASDNQYAEEIS